MLWPVSPLGKLPKRLGPRVEVVQRGLRDLHCWEPFSLKLADKLCTRFLDVNVKKYLSFFVLLTTECLMMEIGLITGYRRVALGPLQDQMLQESLMIKNVKMKWEFGRVSAMTGSFITLLAMKTFNSKCEKEQSPNLLWGTTSTPHRFISTKLCWCIRYHVYMPYSLLADMNCTMCIVDDDWLYPKLISTDSY